MSWDISVMNMPDVDRVEDMPDDYRPETLGSLDDVIKRILVVIPEIDFKDRTWGMLNDDSFSIEFNMGSKEICEGFMMHVRGGGGVVPVIDHLLKELGLRAFDCQTGDFFTADSAEGSFAEWRAFRDRVISTSHTGEK
jgi:hypothetical protein